MAKKNLDELDQQPSSSKFNKLKKFIVGDENEMSAPSGVSEYMDAYTGAPTRAAIAQLQKDFTDIPGAFKAAKDQFGASPKLAPTGRDLANNMGLEGIPATVAGMGLEMAADPSSLITSGLKAATIPLMGLRSLKGIDTVGDIARAVRAAEGTNEARMAVKGAEELAQAARLAQGTEDAIKGSSGIIRADTAAKGVNIANKSPSEFGRIIQLPDIAEAEKATRPVRVPFKSFGKVFRAKK